MSSSRETRTELSMRIASYNVQNLFERAVALSSASDHNGPAVIARQGEINTLQRRADYTSPDVRPRILELLEELGLLHDDDASPLVMLRQNRGQLVRRHQDDTVGVIAKGRGDWLDWVELKSETVDTVHPQHSLGH